MTLYNQGFGMTEIFPMPPTTTSFPDLPDNAMGMPLDWGGVRRVDDHDTLLLPETIGDLVFRPLRPFGMVSGYYKAHEQTVAAFKNSMFHIGDLAPLRRERHPLLRGPSQRAHPPPRRERQRPGAAVRRPPAPAILECACYGVLSRSARRTSSST